MNTRERIIKESIVLFAKNGYEGTSMTTIAKKIDIEKPSLYAHYKSKEEIFKFCLEEIVSKQVSTVIEILTNSKIGTAEERMYTLIRDCSKKVGPSYYSFYYRFLYFPPENMKSTIMQSYATSKKQCDDALGLALDLGITNKEFNASLNKEEILVSYNCLLDGLSYNDKSQNDLESIWKIFWNGIKA